MYYKNYSSLKDLWLAIKFLAFYIALYVFVNMIFIHLCDFIRFQVLAVFLGLVSPFGNLSICRV
jgi:hypothetical protein